MAKRLYTPFDCTSTVAPAVNGTYNDVSKLVNRHLASCLTGTQPLSAGVRVGPWTVGQTAVGEAMVSAPLVGPGTLSGTWSSQLYSQEYAATDDVFTSPELYIVSEDGLTVRGTLWAIGLAGPNTELFTSYRNKTWANGASLTPVAFQDRDRIVWKAGFRNPGTGSTPEASNIYGDKFGIGDLPVNETTAAAELNGWIEFSQNITFHAVEITPVQFIPFAGPAPSVGFASRTPTPNCLQVVHVWLRDDSNTLNPATPCSMAGNGLTWVLEGSQQVTIGVARFRHMVFTAKGAAPAAGVATVTFPQSLLYIASYVDTTATRIRPGQIKFGTSSATAAPSIVLDSDPLPDNSVMSFWACNTASVTTAARTGWGSVYQDGEGYFVQFRQNGEKTGSVAAGGSGDWFDGILELEKEDASYVPSDQLGMSGMFGF